MEQCPGTSKNRKALPPPGLQAQGRAHGGGGERTEVGASVRRGRAQSDAKHGTSKVVPGKGRPGSKHEGK